MEKEKRKTDLRVEEEEESRCLDVGLNWYRFRCAEGEKNVWDLDEYAKHEEQKRKGVKLSKRVQSLAQIAGMNSELRCFAGCGERCCKARYDGVDENYREKYQE